MSGSVPTSIEEPRRWQLSLSPPRPQISTRTFLLLLLFMLPLGPAWHTAAQRCPQTCVCDNSRRHVICRHQNLTEVPNNIPEVRRGGILAWVGSVVTRNQTSQEQ